MTDTRSAADLQIVQARSSSENDVTDPASGQMPDLDVPPPPRATVAAGDSSPDVVAVHDYLARFGYFPNPELAERYPMWRPAMAFDAHDPGVLGEQMQQAVRLYQGANGLPGTGEVTRRSWSSCSSPAAACRTVLSSRPRGWRRSSRRATGGPAPR